jgi:ABC-type cobalamin transport system permease subunit
MSANALDPQCNASAQLRTAPAAAITLIGAGLVLAGAVMLLRFNQTLAD